MTLTIKVDDLEAVKLRLGLPTKSVLGECMIAKHFDSVFTPGRCLLPRGGKLCDARLGRCLTVSNGVCRAYGGRRGPHSRVNCHVFVVLEFPRKKHIPKFKSRDLWLAAFKYGPSRRGDAHAGVASTQSRHVLLKCLAWNHQRKVIRGIGNRVDIC